MKKNHLLLVTALLLAIASCTKKDEENDPREKLIGRYAGNDSVINYTTSVQTGEPAGSDTTVEPIEITVSKGEDDDIIIHDDATWLPSAYPYAGYEYAFISPEGKRFISFSPDGTSFVLRDSSILENLSGEFTRYHRQRWATVYKQ